MFSSILRICVMVVIALGVSPPLTDAGLELDNRWGNIVAIYRFANTSDSGPRDFDGSFHENAQIVKARGNNKALRLRGKGSFASCCNDRALSLLGEFSIVAWIRLKPQTGDGLEIGMHGRNENGVLVGYATVLIGPQQHLGGVFGNLGSDRRLGSVVSVAGKHRNFSDNKWHHIAFTGYGGIYTLFVDGEVVGRRYIDSYVSVFSDKTDIIFANSKAKGTFEGNVFVDDAAFFELGFSVYEIRAIYKNGLNAFIEAMSVDPAGKIVTTWGRIKNENY